MGCPQNICTNSFGDSFLLLLLLLFKSTKVKEIMLFVCGRPVKGKGKVPHWGTSTPQPQGLLCSHPEGAAHRTVYSASASEGRNYVKEI
jgi:hypothetical protein